MKGGFAVPSNAVETVFSPINGLKADRGSGFLLFIDENENVPYAARRCCRLLVLARPMNPE
jgi:hypothetical protein